MNVWKVAKDLKPLLRAGKLRTVHNSLCEHMAALGGNPFDGVLNLRPTNDPATVADTFDGFARECARRSGLKFLYTETNGLLLNPDQWYFSPYGYSRGEPSLDADFGDFDGYTEDHVVLLTGFEPLQEAFQNHYRPRNMPDENEEAAQLAVFIVISKFHLMMAAAAQLMRHQVPLFADGHDRDFVARVN